VKGHWSLAVIYIFTYLKPVSEMTYTVSSGTLNSSIPYHTYILKGVASLHQVWRHWEGHRGEAKPKARGLKSRERGCWGGAANLPAHQLGGLRERCKLPRGSGRRGLLAFCAARLPLLAPQYVLHSLLATNTWPVPLIIIWGYMSPVFLLKIIDYENNQTINW